MSVEVARRVADVRDRLNSIRRSGKAIGLVPTMGALHAGHGRLMDISRSQTDFNAVSIFVNPLQFGPAEDYRNYPRDFDADLAFCAKHGVDLIFAPEVKELYPEDQLATVDVARVSEYLCGAFRPGHFRGVATVVLKLLNIIAPHKAYFGEKDAQQLAVIRRMVRDLNLPVEIAEVQTVREADGLALSSRNRYLSDKERRAAPALHRALLTVQSRITQGARSAVSLKQEAVSILQSEELIKVEYVDIVDPEEMQPVIEINPPVRAMGAIWIGHARLIDNVLCPPRS